MTEHHEPDLNALDRAARTASDGLRTHVQRHVEPELMLAALPPTAPSRNRGRFLAAAAAAVLLIGTVAVFGDGPGDGDDRSRLELDEDGNKLPAPQPGVISPLGPNDGRDSIQLPVTVEPNVDLEDGEKVTVSGTGFVPGERVGIVQCASEAGVRGDESRPQRLGIDACNTGTVQYADADADGAATGTFTVRRVLTTPATGTVDCALDAQRCVIGMGALTDYDRSGGNALSFVGGGEPIDIPTLTVTPADGLADGDTVHIEGEGFTPGPVSLVECSIDPAGCWTVGNEIRLSPSEVEDLGFGEQYGGEFIGVGLIADADGRISGDIQVWRFLPTTDPTAYIDCAVSECAIRASSYITDGDAGTSAEPYAPAPAALAFEPGGSGPTPPAIAVTPTRDLEPGDDIVVRGAGFEPGAYYSVSLCAGPPGDLVNTFGCTSAGDDGQDRIDDDGGFARELEVPDLSGFASVFGGGATTTVCAAGDDCGSTMPSSEELCDGVHSVCTIRVDTYQDGYGPTAPQFPAAPIVITFRR